MMKNRRGCLRCVLFLSCLAAFGQQSSSPALTIYNQDFAVVRQVIPLDLKAGTNQVSFADVTAHIEPDSVILRDLGGRRTLRILEQNYRNDPVSQELLLSVFEGGTIDFQVQHVDSQGQTHTEIVRGKIIRSGYVRPPDIADPAVRQYIANLQAANAPGANQPIVEVNGKLQFALPGLPLFPTLGDNTILQPTLSWSLENDKAGSSRAELSYVTGGMSWHADYNVVAPPKGGTLEMVGWVTIENHSGKQFDEARIKLMAGDVNKIAPGFIGGALNFDRLQAFNSLNYEPVVTEKAFDEYHLYTLERTATLRDNETKQVEFARAAGIQSQRVYVYQGALLPEGNYYQQIREDQNYGTQSNPKVWVMQEFKNSKANTLGMPLPKGRLRFYRRDEDGQVEFTGENTIDHTPADETIRVRTGNAFDLVGERRRTNYVLATNRRSLDEAFEIKVRNHKKEPVEVRVVEKMYRWNTWEIRQKSDNYTKLDSQTIEFRVQVPPDGEKAVNYSVHYSW